MASLLHSLGIPANPATAISDRYALELLVAAGLIAFFAIVRLTLSVEKPNPAQQIAEIIHDAIGGQASEIIGHGYEKFQAFVTCIFLFVLSCNLLGLIPGIPAPTTSPMVTLGIAIPTFLYYNYQGFRAQGVVGYIKHFCGPIWWMAWLLLPIEIVSHLARIMSLTIRLYANMYASDMLTLGFFSLIPIGVPAIFLGLHVFVSIIQAFIFTLLSMIYLSLAVSHEH
ncbi:MAG: F0F1 ATP synthase subunit A [Terracidiphilus sp.]